MDVSHLRGLGGTSAGHGNVSFTCNLEMALTEWTVHHPLLVQTTADSFRTRVISGANIAGIYGAQIFRADDRPYYRRGFSINIAVLSVGLSLAIGRYIDDRIRRRRIARKLQVESGSEHNSQDQEQEISPARPSDVQPLPILIGDGLKPVVDEKVVTRG